MSLFSSSFLSTHDSHRVLDSSQDRIDLGQRRVLPAGRLAFGRDQLMKTAGSAATALPAPVRLIELHLAAQRARVVTILHHLHQLVLDGPRSMVAHSQLPGDFQRRYAILRRRYQAHGHETRAQRQLRAGQNRACVTETW